MKLPYGANEDNFKKCKKIVSEFTNDDKNLDEVTLEIMNIPVFRRSTMKFPTF